MSNPTTTITAEEAAEAAYDDAEKYAKGRAIFAAVTRHGLDAIEGALAIAEDVIPLRYCERRTAVLDVIDALEEAQRELR